MSGQTVSSRPDAFPPSPHRQQSPQAAGLWIRKDHLIDLTLGGVAILSLFLPLWIGGLGALVFLASGLALCLWRPQATFAAFRRNWPILVFPAWGGLTMLWSDYPMATLRLDIQVLLTLALSLAVISILPVRQTLILLSTFLAGALLTVLTSSQTVEIYQTGEVVRVGVMGSKNNVSMYGASALTVGAMLLSLPGEKRLVRFLAILTIIVAVLAIIQAKSMGTLFAAFLCAGAGAFLWGMRFFIRSAFLRAMILYGGALLLAVMVAILFLSSSYQGYVEFMYGLGKDPTLTGRTFLWSVGARIIDENFWGGLGLGAFWKVSNPDAILLWTYGKRAIGTPYGFHNTYIHNWVETGIIGATIIFLLMVQLLRKTLSHAINGATGYEAAAGAFSLFVFAKSFLETVAFSPFSAGAFYFCLVWIILNRTHPLSLR